VTVSSEVLQEFVCFVPSIVLADQAPEVAEFFGSMIALDDPRHIRLRMIVQKAFTPRVVAMVEEAVKLRTKQIVQRMLERHPGGHCDIVREVAAPLPLQIICSMMGIPRRTRSASSTGRM
jgi:cytochrome P450